MDEPPFALVCGWRYPLLIIAKGGSFSTVSTLRLFSSTSLACGFLYEQKSTAHFCAMLFSGGDYRDRTGDLLHAMQALSRTVSKHTPTRKCGDRLNIALIRSIHQKGSQLHPASRNHAPPTRQFYHPIFKCVNGFCSERRSFTRKVFSDSLLSAILILHIKVALFIFPKSIDKEVFSTMPMYFCCFLSMNQPHDP